MIPQERLDAVVLVRADNFLGTRQSEIQAKRDRVLWSAMAFYSVRRLDHLCCSEDGRVVPAGCVQSGAVNTTAGRCCA